jgi:hypothetical protein
MQMIFRPIVSAIVITIGFLVVACGASEDGARRPAPTNVPLPTSPTTPDAVESPLRAEDFVLTEGPETAGLTRTPMPGAPGEMNPADLRKAVDELGGCLGTRFDSLPEQTYIGPYFGGLHGGTQTIVYSTASILSTGMIDDERAALRNPKYAGCFGELLARNLAGGSSSGLGTGADPSSDVKTARFVEPPAGATAAIEVVVNLIRPNGPLKVHTITVAVMNRRVESTVTVSHFASPPDEKLVQRVASQLVRKAGTR